ncbi:gag-pol polyprotein [Tanacetum coccineum]
MRDSQSLSDTTLSRKGKQNAIETPTVIASLKTFLEFDLFGVEFSDRACEVDDRQEEEPDTSPLDSTQSQQAWVNLIQWDPMIGYFDPLLSQFKAGIGRRSWTLIQGSRGATVSRIQIRISAQRSILEWCVCNSQNSVVEEDFGYYGGRQTGYGATNESYARSNSELLNSQTHGEDSNSHGSVNKEGSSGWRSNDIKVDIPEYDAAQVCLNMVVQRLFKAKRMGKEKIRTWPKMKAKMKQKFLPPHHIQASFSQLHSLKQGAGSAEDYSREFEYLLMKCDIPEDDPQTLVRYLGGLEPRVANVVELHTYQTLAELTILAHKVDSQQRSKGKQEIKPMFKPNPQTKSTIPTQPNSPITPKPVNINSPQTNTPKAPRRCFRCQGLGHIASECPNKRLVTLTDFEIAGGYDFGVETSDDQVRTGDPDEEVVGPDVGELLVVRRALSSTPVREEKLQREAIFHTRCTVAQKVCSVIIDGGSCTNVASQTMVSKLGLLNEPHPAPYVIHWLNQGKGINVTHRVLLSFSIGKWYADKIWCDVIPMDACHVLLGRPWQFDRRVIHDGYLNTYSFVHNNRKIILTPIDPTTNSTKSTFSLSNLLKSEQHEYHSAKEFILLGLDEEEDKPHQNTHPLVQSLLKSYSHVFPTEIPPGLPPMRSIQHKIDLIPGSALPNKPAYHTNPQETTEIQRQVDELLEK